MMDSEEEIKLDLAKQGYEDIGVPEFGPDTELAEHTHDVPTVHVILRGEITLIDQAGSKTYRTGDRFVIPAGTKHSGKCGPEGCRFIVGHKKS